MSDSMHNRSMNSSMNRSLNRSVRIASTHDVTVVNQTEPIERRNAGQAHSAKKQ